MQNKNKTGFTLTELLAAVSILGILTAISLPMFTGQVSKTRQAEAQAFLAQLQISTMAYIDEFQTPPTHWGDLSRISTIMTDKGPIEASNRDGKGGAQLGEEIAIPNEKYKIRITTGKDFGYEAFSQQESHQAKNLFNVIACLNTETGATDIAKGNETTVGQNQLKCNPSS